jgi:hypothetical protein
MDPCGKARLATRNFLAKILSTMLSPSPRMAPSYTCRACSRSLSRTASSLLQVHTLVNSIISSDGCRQAMHRGKHHPKTLSDRIATLLLELLDYTMRHHLSQALRRQRLRSLQLLNLLLRNLLLRDLFKREYKKMEGLQPLVPQKVSWPLSHPKSVKRPH